MNGRELTKLREKAGLSIWALSEKSGYAAATIYKFEDGSHPIIKRAEKILKLALAQKSPG